MKKFIISIVLMAAAVISANAQNRNIWRNNGYRFNVELSETSGDQFAISTSHGYTFNSGLFLGGGVSFRYDDAKEHYMTPLYAEGRWSFLKGIVSPFIDAKIGGNINITDGKKSGFYFAPSVGLDIWHFSLSVGYDVLTNVGNGLKVGLAVQF